MIKSTSAPAKLEPCPYEPTENLRRAFGGFNENLHKKTLDRPVKKEHLDKKGNLWHELVVNQANHVIHTISDGI